MGNKGKSQSVIVKVSVSCFLDLVSIAQGGELGKAVKQIETHFEDTQSRNTGYVRKC